MWKSIGSVPDQCLSSSLVKTIFDNYLELFQGVPSFLGYLFVFRNFNVFVDRFIARR